jgi:Lrp/AsnC family leucine-responsive transcriptional regulator
MQNQAMSAIFDQADERAKDLLTLSLDATDLRILEALQTDASQTNDALAKSVHTSPATCLRRVRRLVETGVVARRVALLDPRAVGVALTAFVEVTLDRQSAEAVAAFEARAVADPAVRQCHRVAPGPDFVLVVQARGMEAYQALVRRLFTDDANVRNVKAFFSTHCARFDTRVELPAAR